jgi:predicted transcriptional regulator
VLPRAEINAQHILCRMPPDIRLSRTQADVLAALEPGGILSVDALAKTANLTGWQVRRTVPPLESAGLIVHAGLVGRRGYQITAGGRRALSAYDEIDATRARPDVAPHDVW